LLTPKIIQIQKQFKALEIHAAHSGRLVLDALINCVQASTANNSIQILEEVQENCKAILEVMPPYAPPINSINQVMLELEHLLESNIEVDRLREKFSNFRINFKIENLHDQITKVLIPILPSNATIYTHTLSETVMGVLLNLNKYLSNLKVIVTESRPNNDGWVTARKLAEVGIETQITIDFEFVSAINQADLMLSGTEIINPDGSVVCKVGILPAATYCKKVNKKFYVIADTNKICPVHSENFQLTPIELTDLGIHENLVLLTPFGNLFDTTPSELISGYITEKGILSVSDIQKFINNKPVSKWLKFQFTNNQ
jgi:translation initiation factor 2B subunit (eIF-2B alpha/beta/delta family)